MERLEKLLIDIKESLERDIRNLDEKMRQEFKQLNTRFDTQATRLERHAALLQTGSRCTHRMNGWAERVDAALEEKDRQILDLTERIRKLENGRKDAA
jgi:hypothetical protein